MAQEFSSVPSAGSPIVSGLPSYLTSFLGREEDVACLRDYLLTPHIRLVTLTGFGGMGKTRLAAAVVPTMTSEWRRIWFVSLAHVLETGTATATIARELGIDTDRSTTRDLQTAPCLLILDNFEHLVDAASHVLELLQRWPLLTILVTSRAPLNLSGEQAYALQPLGVDGDGGTGSAVRLFIDRARSHAHGLCFTPADTIAIHDICRQLEGIPLAIELAAARIPLLTLTELRDRLTSQLTLLTGGPRDVPARQRTLRATIAWSYDLIPPAEQDVLQALSVFSGGFTLDGAAGVLDLPPTTMMDHLTALIASSLVLPTPTTQIPQMRYRLLDPVREFAFGCLTVAGRASSIQLAHAEYYTSLAEHALPLYDGAHLVPTMMSVCAEVDNARAAVTWSLAEGNREHGVRLAGALWRVWAWTLSSGDLIWMNRVAQGWQVLNQALPYTEGLSVEAVTELLSGAASLGAFLGRFDEAIGHARELWSRASRAGYHYGMYWALLGEGRSAYNREDYTRAIALWEECLQLAPKLRNPESHTAMILLSLCRANGFIGRLQESNAQLAKALDLARTCGNPTMIGWATLHAGRKARAQGAFRDALVLLREAAAVGASMQGDRHISTLVSIARIAIALDHSDWAIELLGFSRWSPFPEDQRELEEALAEVQQVVGVAALERIAIARRNADPARIAIVLDQLEALLNSTPAVPIRESPLSDREREVLLLLTAGRSNRAIADQLSLSERTVENHVQHIFTKLSVTNRAGAAAWAVRHNLD